MSKQDVIVRNLKALTHSRSFETSVKGWTVKNIISLSKREMQACELCGTRFCGGARIHHARTAATILVGGTCLETILKSHFPPKFKVSEYREKTLTALRRAYGDLIDPGNWTRWLVENAPKRLAQPVAELISFGVVLTDKELEALIRCHDSKRLFRRTALLPGARALEKVLGKQIPAYITVNQARKIESAFASKPARMQVPVVARDYATRVLRPAISSDPELRRLLDSLNPLEQRAVTGLAALDERAAIDGTPLCSGDLAALWPAPRSGPMFVWNPKIGLGFVGADDHLGNDKAYVWLWRSSQYQKCVYNMQYWLGIVGCSEHAVKAVEEDAFARGGQH